MNVTPVSDKYFQLNIRRMYYLISKDFLSSIIANSKNKICILMILFKIKTVQYTEIGTVVVIIILRLIFTTPNALFDNLCLLSDANSWYIWKFKTWFHFWEVNEINKCIRSTPQHRKYLARSFFPILFQTPWFKDGVTNNSCPINFW